MQIRHLVKALGRDHEVDLLVLRGQEQPHVERYLRGRVLRVPVPEAIVSEQVLGFQRALLRQIDSADYDVIHACDPWTCAPAVDTRRRLGHVVVYDTARTKPMSSSFDESVAEHFDECAHKSIRHADVVLAGTSAAHRALRGAGATNVQLVPPGVDIDAFDWEEPPSGDPVVLYLGAVAHGMGLRILIQAMSTVSAQVGRSRLRIVGPGPARFIDDLRTLARELQLGSRIEFCSAIPHEAVAQMVARATVCVVPTAAEVQNQPTALFPTRLLEFWACRRAVVAPRRGSLHAVSEDGSHLALFAPGDPNDLARALCQTLSNSSLRESLAQRGYDLVRSAFAASSARRSVRSAYAALFASPAWQRRVGSRPRIELPIPADISPQAPMDQPELGDADDNDDTTGREVTCVDPWSPAGERADTHESWPDAMTVPDASLELLEPPFESHCDDKGPVDTAFAAGELEARPPGKTPEVSSARVVLGSAVVSAMEDTGPMDAREDTDS